MTLIIDSGCKSALDDLSGFRDQRQRFVGVISTVWVTVRL